ncbi:hypothetical protein ACET3Z_013656 [Daucus carota]
MRIRANNLHLKPTGPAIICVLNQSPWDVMSSSQLSENLQIIETDDRYFRESAYQSFSGELNSPIKSVLNHNESTAKVVQPQLRRRQRKEVKVDANCDNNEIYDYYSGFGPNWKKRRVMVQNNREAVSTSNPGREHGNDDDDNMKPLKERSLKSILEGV